MKVEEFGFGFPPRIIGFKKSEGKWRIVGLRQKASEEGTIYSINWIPLGGFVRILGENNDHEEDPKSFINRPFWGRFFTLVAGVSMNVVLAWILISIGLIIGLPVAVDDISSLPAHSQFKNAKISIIEVAPNFPADKVGIKPGDEFVSIDGQSFKTVPDLRNYIVTNKGKDFQLELRRDNKALNFSVQSESNPQAGEGPTGIVLANTGVMALPWYIAPWEGIRTTGIQIANIAEGIYKLFSNKIGLSSLGGPIKIAQLTGQVSRLGFIYLLQFTAFLSLNLAILNILPFPALDGGRVLFLLIEKVRGKRNNQAVEQWFNTVGFVLLITLMVIVTAKDITSFGGFSRILQKVVGG